MLNSVNTFVNVGYGEDMLSSSNDLGNDLRNDYTNGETRTKSDLGKDIGTGSAYDKTNDYNNIKNSLVNGARKLMAPLGEYIDEEMGVLNKKGGRFLNKLFINNEEFRKEIINFVGDKKELDLELILDKRCKTNTLHKLGKKCLPECITSKDNTKDLNHGSVFICERTKSVVNQAVTLICVN